ncbi:hypothetical protein FRB94_010740 [Tulasnella sp. JGI-2019a]|nr:hypothetical protein FRB94_010740 [Tulasnella sp. JGI-2019a]KAG8997031.1 hypothetical protein FRB93_000524 [Tulasnella sp. JGI-2019a]
MARIGKRDNVSEWLLPAYKALCERAEAMTLSEGEELGLQVVIELNRLRESMVFERSGEDMTDLICSSDLLK